MHDENIPPDQQSSLDQEYSEAPVYCTECGKRVDSDEDIEREAHQHCFEKLYKSIKFI